MLPHELDRVMQDLGLAYRLAGNDWTFLSSSDQRAVIVTAELGSRLLVYGGFHGTMDARDLANRLKRMRPRQYKITSVFVADIQKVK